MRFRLATSRRMISIAFSTSWPGSVTRRKRLPWRAKMSMPSSSSSSRMALLMPGCEVNSALAVSVRFRLRRTASCTKRNWCRFMGRLLAGRQARPAAPARWRPWPRAPRGCSPTASCSCQRTDGCSSRRRSIIGGRSLRRWPPVPRNIGSTSTWLQPAAHSSAPASCQAGRHELQVGQAQLQPAAAAERSAGPRPRRARPSAGRARHGRTGSVPASSSDPLIGSAPASRRRPATAT